MTRHLLVEELWELELRSELTLKLYLLASVLLAWGREKGADKYEIGQPANSESS